MATIYFSKISLNDDRIFEEYEGKDVLKEIQKTILSKITAPHIYEKREFFELSNLNNEKKNNRI